MQTSLNYRTNRDLFSNYYLNEHFPETEVWDEINDDDLREKRAEIVDLWERERDTVAERTESSLEEKFIRPLFRILGIPFEVEETVQRGQRRPDYGFFPSEDEARNAFSRKKEGGNFYENAIAVADAKRWGRPLDTRGSGEHKRDFENPSYQIHVYLQETPAQWAVLTDGKKWRLYYGPTSHRLDSYYEVDLPTVLEKGDLDDFKYFYLFFRNEAFIEDAGGDSFLDDVYDESNVFAQELGEDLQDNIYEAIKVLSEGYLQYSGNDLDEEDLGLIHDSSLIYLYRLIFVLYAEAEGRQLLDTDNEIYEEQYSLNALKQEVADELDSADPKYRDWQDNVSDRLDELFSLIDQGSKSRGIPEEDLYIPAYNGGLFRTDPDEDDNPEARFLANHTVGDSYLARVVELLTRSQNGGGKIFVDYSSLDVRHLGSIYEGLLEYKLDVADRPLKLDDGEYVSAEEGDDIVVQDGEVYLTTGSGERKETGSYYTPEYVVEYIVDETLGPLVDDIREDLVGQTTYKKGDEEAGTFADQFADRIFDLKVLDPAMGSGHFLTSVVDYLAREIIDAQERQAEQQGVETIDKDHDINWARRKVAQRCIYGVDLNPLATELAKVSLWLRTLAAEQPLAFLDHHLKTGNSLVGSDIDEVLTNGDDEVVSESGQLTLQQSFDRTRQQAIEHVMDRFQQLLSIDNETLEDAKEMEDVYDKVRDDPLYQQLLAMANVHIAEQFGLNIPSDAYERMARALKSESWANIEDQDWFNRAQGMAVKKRFFHWELEYPVVFYGVDGERKADAGFDAVIGNPPYISIENLDDKVVNYLRGSFSAAEYGRIDIYIPFVEHAIELCRKGGSSSMIVPDKWLVSDYGEKLRRSIIQNHSLLSVWDLRKENVFKDASNSPIVYQVQREGLTTGEVDFQSGSRGVEWYSCPQSAYEDTYENKIIIGLKENHAEIIEKIGEGVERIRDFAYVSFGAQPGSLSRFVFDDYEDAVDGALNLGFSNNPESIIKRFIRGRNIDRYSINYDNEYLLYDPDELHRPAFPELFENNKVVISEISSTLKSTFDQQQFYGNEKVVFVVRGSDLRGLDESIRSQRPIPDPDGISDFGSEINMRYLTAVLNSTVLEFYFEFAVSDGLNVYPDDVRYLPIKKTNEQIELADHCDSLSELKTKKTNLNLNLLDYLGNYEDGPSLPDVGLFQPASDSVLNGTAQDYENLRVSDVRTERDAATVTVWATARYKPEDEDAHETDTYGYTETDFSEAFSLVDCSENEAALVEAFVPLAVEEGGGFAGFRENATKTNSLIDRLKAITLPDPDKIADDLERYVETKERADELDEKIAKTDHLIDEIVYDLYELTDEEIDIVEKAVQND